MSETAEKAKVIRTTSAPEKLSGVWRMKYKLTNRMGTGGFSGRNLTTYPDPITGQPRHLYNGDGNRTNGFFIEKQTTMFLPDQNHSDRNIVDWLLGHPEVGIQIEHAGLSKGHLAKKISNPRIELINLDYEEVVDLEDEDRIDKLVGRISLDKGSQALGMEKLRFILAKLNKNYIEAKYLTKPHIEKQKLRKRLKDYTRTSIEACIIVEGIIENLDSARIEYEIKELMRHEVFYIASGMYKYDSVPLGTSLDSVVKYLRENPDFYAEISKELYKKLKIESQG